MRLKLFVQTLMKNSNNLERAIKRTKRLKKALEAKKKIRKEAAYWHTLVKPMNKQIKRDRPVLIYGQIMR